jgi:hypothetical protein
VIQTTNVIIRNIDIWPTFCTSNMLADQTVWVQRTYTVNKNTAGTTHHLNPTLEPESGLIIYVITKFKDQ